MGFDRVFDTSFSADLTIMEEAAELVHRITTGGKLPMMTSCSPGWIKFVEQFYPSLIGNLSTCKSPQQMMGAVIKHYWAVREGIDPKSVYSVSIMPCTAKKFEAGRPEMLHEGIPDIDAVLTTRELVQIIKTFGIDLESLAGESADDPFGERSSAGKLFGASGGVMEAAIRTAHFMITGRELDVLKITSLRGLEGIKEASVDIGGTEVRVAAASGLGNARKLMDQLMAGRSDLHFIEIMSCPGGCIAGGGQPLNADPEVLKARMQALYSIDRDSAIRTSHSNPSIKRIYDDFLGEPGSHKAHELLHTSYVERSVLR
jgi:NADH-quinone oxidoreductase subunit G/NADP-reducing hydrogenase subunit HndD